MPLPGTRGPTVTEAQTPLASSPMMQCLSLGPSPHTGPGPSRAPGPGCGGQTQTHAQCHCDLTDSEDSDSGSVMLDSLIMITPS